MWVRASLLFRRFTDTKYKRIRGTGTVKIRKTRHKISVDVRMFFWQCGVSERDLQRERALFSIDDISVTTTVDGHGDSSIQCAFQHLQSRRLTRIAYVKPAFHGPGSVSNESEAAVCGCWNPLYIGPTAGDRRLSVGRSVVSVSSGGRNRFLLRPGELPAYGADRPTERVASFHAGPGRLRSVVAARRRRRRRGGVRTGRRADGAVSGGGRSGSGGRRGGGRVVVDGEAD